MKGQATYVVHVRVRQEDIGLIHCSLWAPSGVKDQLQLRNADAGLLRRGNQPTSGYLAGALVEVSCLNSCMVMWVQLNACLPSDGYAASLNLIPSKGQALTLDSACIYSNILRNRVIPR